VAGFASPFSPVAGQSDDFSNLLQSFPFLHFWQVLPSLQSLHFLPFLQSLHLAESLHFEESLQSLHFEQSLQSLHFEQSLQAQSLALPALIHVSQDFFSVFFTAAAGGAGSAANRGPAKARAIITAANIERNFFIVYPPGLETHFYDCRSSSI
jgi:hypothetical protein